MIFFNIDLIIVQVFSLIESFVVKMPGIKKGLRCISVFFDFENWYSISSDFQLNKKSVTAPGKCSQGKNKFRLPGSLKYFIMVLRKYQKKERTQLYPQETGFVLVLPSNKKIIDSSNAKKQNRLTINLLSGFLVAPTGELSNFLLEDFDAVLKFMNAKMQKKKNMIIYSKR